MEKTIKFLSFWAINDDLNIERLKEQLSSLPGRGLPFDQSHALPGKQAFW